MFMLQMACVLSAGAAVPAAELPRVAFPVPDHVSRTLSSPAPRELLLRLTPDRTDLKAARPEFLLPPVQPGLTPDTVLQPLVPLLPPDLRLEWEQRLMSPQAPLYRNPVYTEEDKRLFVKRFPLLRPDDVVRIIPAQPAEPAAPPTVEAGNPDTKPEPKSP